MALSSKLLQSVLAKTGDLIYPKVCLQCDAAGDEGLDLCHRCYQRLPWIVYACKRCALPLPSADAVRCGACSKREYFFDNAYAPFHFEGFVRDAVYQFKFNHKLNQGKLLAQLLQKSIEKKEFDYPEIIVPVPLHKKRLRQRGYNQALEIARIVSKYLDCELVLDQIYRNRDTSVQMDLPAKQRHKNVKNAFSMKNNSTTLKDKHVCIVDDVMTTGNTVNEVAKCIRQAGTRRIDVWCIARVT